MSFSRLSYRDRQADNQSDHEEVLPYHHFQITCASSLKPLLTPHKLCRLAPG
jgi:hypothetical protein